MLAGFLGIGGGTVLVPMMVGFLWLDQHKAHGTSLSIVVPIAIAGAVIYTLRGHVDWTLVATIGGGSVAGVIAGAKLMMKISPERLRQAFGIYTIAIAVLLLLR